jgi:hypothetical protein
MIPETITYNDLDGKPVQKVWHFSLDRAEIAEMKIRHDGTGEGDLEDYLSRIVAEQDNNKLLDNFKAILFKSVGIRKGNYIDKSPEIQAEFVGSGAYEANLINGIIPKDMAEQAAAKEAEDKSKQYTDADLLAMTDEAFFAIAGGSNPMKWDQRFLLLASKRKNAA